MGPAARAHHELYIVEAREVDAQQLEEVLLGRGNGLAREQLEQVAKVVRRVKRNILHRVAEHQARRYEKLAKVGHVDALLLEARKVNARLAQQINRVLRVCIV